MEMASLYEQLTKRKAHAIELLKGGFSNKTYLVNGVDVLRVKERSDPFFYNPEHESSVLRALAPSGLFGPPGTPSANWA